jgi:hypothetical protein
MEQEINSWLLFQISLQLLTRSLKEKKTLGHSQEMIVAKTNVNRISLQISIFRGEIKREIQFIWTHNVSAAGIQ